MFIDCKKLQEIHRKQAPGASDGAFAYTIGLGSLAYQRSKRSKRINVGAGVLNRLNSLYGISTEDIK